MKKKYKSKKIHIRLGDKSAEWATLKWYKCREMHEYEIEIIMGLIMGFRKAELTQGKTVNDDLWVNKILYFAVEEPYPLPTILFSLRINKFKSRPLYYANHNMITA